MASLNQERVQQAITAIPPKPDVTLVGWVLMAEWMEPDGQKLLARLVSGTSSAWQVKGYLHEGLYTQWLANMDHHNPGHPSEWVEIPSSPAEGEADPV